MLARYLRYSGRISNRRLEVSVNTVLCPGCGVECEALYPQCKQCGTSLGTVSEIDWDPNQAAGRNKESAETYKLATLGIFLGCLIAGALVLWLLIGSSGTPASSAAATPKTGDSSDKVTPTGDTHGSTNSNQKTESDLPTETRHNSPRPSRRRRDSYPPVRSAFANADVTSGQGKVPTMVQPQ